MKKLSSSLFIGVFSFLVVVGMFAATAQSRPQYNKEFASKYIKADSTDPNEQSFAEACKEDSCVVCHISGEKKKVRNGFGRELAKLLHNEKDTGKIDEAFDNVLKMKSDPKDPNSPTYGDLIKHGKLPATDK